MLVRRRVLLPLLLGSFVFAVYILTAPNDLQNNGDTWLRYQTTQSIVDKGHIWVEHPAFLDKRMVKGVNGKLYTIYDPGQIIAMAPLYIIGKFLAHHVTGDYMWTPLYTTHILDDIFGSLLAIVFYLIALHLGYSRKISAILTLIFAFASVTWPDAESMLEHTQVTFFLALAVLLSLIYTRGRFRQRWWVVASAISIGFSFLTRYDAGVLFPIIPLYLAAARISQERPALRTLDALHPESTISWASRIFRSSWRDANLWRNITSDWTLFVAGLLPAFAAAAMWNYTRFGSPTKTGIPPTFGEPILKGLAGLTLSPGKGLIWYMPIVFALPFVIQTFYRQHRLITLYFAAFVVVELLLFSLVIYWHGDPAWGPRYIYPTAPFLILPLGNLLERWVQLKSLARFAFVALVGLSISVQFVGTVTPAYRFWYREIQAQLVARQGFNWGYKRGQFWYFYYWNIDRNPILQAYENLYEITALRLLHQNQYSLQVPPIPTNEHLNLSNPVHNYEINNFNLWWMGVTHPFIGTEGDELLALFWLIVACGLSAALWKEIQAEPVDSKRVVIELKRRPA